MRETRDHKKGATGTGKFRVRTPYDPECRELATPVSRPPRRGYNQSFFKTLALALSISSLPLLSGCVGSTVSSTLDTAALETPSDLTPEEEAYVSDFTTLSELPVPVRAPQSSELSLASAENSPAINAVNSITAADQSTISDSVDLLTAQNAPETSTNPGGQATEMAALAPSTQNSRPIVDPATPVPASRVGSGKNNPAAGATASNPKPAKKQGGFWSALFGGKSKTARKPSLAEKTQIARNSPSANSGNASRSSSTGALPGVKRSSALFGIGADDKNKPLSETQGNVQVASVGSFGRYQMVNGLVLQTQSVEVECFKPELMRILRTVERHYGKKVMVTSGYRNPNRNRRAGGVKNSTHIYCKAADIQVSGISKWDLAKFLRTVDGRGGVGTYCRTKSVHIDTGSVRDWHHPCRRSKSRMKKKA